MKAQNMFRNFALLAAICFGLAGCGGGGSNPPTPAPVIASITPTVGPMAGGTQVTIAGTNFYGTTSVTFGGVAATNVNIVSNLLVQVTTPAGTTATANVTLYTPGGSDTYSFFTYQ